MELSPYLYRTPRTKIIGRKDLYVSGEVERDVKRRREKHEQIRWPDIHKGESINDGMEVSFITQLVSWAARPNLSSAGKAGSGGYGMACREVARTLSASQ